MTEYIFTKLPAGGMLRTTRTGVYDNGATIRLYSTAHNDTQQCPHCGAYPIWLSGLPFIDGYSMHYDAEMLSVGRDFWMCGNCGEAIS